MDRATLLLVEIASIGILSMFMFVMARGGLVAGSKDGRPREMKDVLHELAVIAVASWVAEVSCIRLYAFYQYDAPWTLFVDVMPLLVAIIWPFVLLSARELVVRLRLGGAAALFVIVLYDAALIEPVAVKAGLWSWNEPGLFGVPIIGLLGWGYFGAATSICLEWLPRKYRIATIVIAPLVTHVALLVTWWGGLRWVLRWPIPAEVAAVAALLIATGLGVFVRRRDCKAPLEVMAPRMAAAGLFFVLLFTWGANVAPLVVYALTFAIPYLLATRWRFEGTPGRPLA
jgi:hypothetical protein